MLLTKMSLILRMRNKGLVGDRGASAKAVVRQCIAQLWICKTTYFGVDDLSFGKAISFLACYHYSNFILIA